MCIRDRYLVEKEAVLESLKSQKVTVEKAPYVENAYYLKDYDYLPALDAFRVGSIQVQDVSSMLVGEIADPKEGDYVIDLCAAPGGKTLCIADKLKGTGRVDARDISCLLYTSGKALSNLWVTLYQWI